MWLLPSVSNLISYLPSCESTKRELTTKEQFFEEDAVWVNDLNNRRTVEIQSFIDEVEKSSIYRGNNGRETAPLLEEAKDLLREARTAYQQYESFLGVCGNRQIFEDVASEILGKRLDEINKKLVGLKDSWENIQGKLSHEGSKEKGNASFNGLMSSLNVSKCPMPGILMLA